MIKSPSNDADALVAEVYDKVFGEPGGAYREAMDQKLMAMAEGVVLYGSMLPDELLETFVRWLEESGGEDEETGP